MLGEEKASEHRGEWATRESRAGERRRSGNEFEFVVDGKFTVGISTVWRTIDIKLYRPEPAEMGAEDTRGPSSDTYV